MSKGGQKSNNTFEKPTKVSLKVKVKKLTEKKAAKKHKKTLRQTPSREAGRPIRQAQGRKRRKGKREEKEVLRKIRRRVRETIPGIQEISEGEGRILQEKVERSKEFIMWSGVIFFMLLISSFWVFNIRHTFESAKFNNDNESSLATWQEMTKEIEEKIGDFKEDYEKIKQTDESGSISGLPESNTLEQGDLFSSSTPETGQTASTTENIEVTSEEIEELKKKLEAGQ